MARVFPSKTTPISCAKLSIEDVAKIFRRLEKSVLEQGDLEISELLPQENEPSAEFEERKQKIKESAFRVTVTINGSDGSSFFGDNEALFYSESLPDEISMVYMTNKTAYNGVARIDPNNGFELTLDFSKPPLLDFRNSISSPTGNVSGLRITGDRDSWVATIHSAVMDIVDLRRTRRRLIHIGAAYDIGLAVIGFPLGFYFCRHSSPLIEKLFAESSVFLTSAAYFYLMLLTLWIHRVMFEYARWIFPTLELEKNNSNIVFHRGFWWTIIVSVLGSIAYDLKALI
ncbi:hypothetical protein EOI86_00530 [Hwanghaeella grinnelliae]|uniref:Uncharacterized protein n=1 Tax=Hwanghaeella grinnelliae TaxID=2500179 RepID=A0A437QTL1_9PROT|nr:hypothetical protein [Hwanghaeella grinnelliae]RVU37826.1 hypothetical protein EOI86_00530 [Hwanghaeella grinnelliae]